MSKKFEILLSEYSESHENETNKLIHWVCVPLIFWSIVALLYSIPNSPLLAVFGDGFFSNWAVIIMFPVLIYYISLSLSIGIGMMFFIGICLILSFMIDQNSNYPLWAIAILIFILAWLGQFYGHKVEGKKPSFLKDIQFLLIGPAWLLHFVFKKIGVRY